MSRKLLLPATTSTPASGLRQIQRRVASEVTTQLVLALIISRLDYCNAALAGLPQTTIAPLQRVQNVAARLVFELGPREHVTPCLLQLHWLPVRWRIQFKLSRIMHSVFNGNCAAYLLSDIVQTVSASRPRLRLRSSSSTDHVLPRLRTKFGERAFSHAGPSACGDYNYDSTSIRRPFDCLSKVTPITLLVIYLVKVTVT